MFTCVSSCQVIGRVSQISDLSKILQTFCTASSLDTIINYWNLTTDTGISCCWTVILLQTPFYICSMMWRLHFTLTHEQDPEILHLAEGHCRPEGLMWPTEQHHLQRAEKQFWGSQTRHSPPPSCPLRTIHEDHKQNWWQGTTLTESNTHWKLVWLCAENMDTALTLLM